MFPAWYKQQLLPKITNKTGHCMLSFSSIELHFYDHLFHQRIEKHPA